MTVQVCIVCSSVPKYKCPKCFLPYCSVNCCKTHKIDCSGGVKQEVDEQESKKYKYYTDDTVPEEKLQLLSSNPKLLDVLENPHVRRIMEDIDNSPYPEETIHKAMLEPIFVELADECLKVVQDI